jgi:16S rRNA C967 or C1407 C5-methylase (RsmB/RsmF family)/NOL1/NOP2/fmu family ribosome biogenesis protein
VDRLPEKFEQSIRAKLGTDFPAFIASLEEPVPLSIRMNPRKNTVVSTDLPVPWTRYGKYLSVRPVFTLDPLFHGGSYYVQEASSMFLEQALKQSVDLDSALNVLDLCAAPGGKSTHLLSLLSRESLLVSNEVIRARAAILSENIQKWGYPNAMVTNNDPRDFQGLKGFFDVVVVDAPCSGEGLFRKDPAAMFEWSPENVALCCDRQKRIVADVWDSLRENGILIYSTCTYNESENEDNLRWLQENYSIEFIKLATDPSWGVEEVNIGKIHAYRFFPHQAKGEGFFISAIRKTEAATSSKLKAKKSLAGPPSKNIRERLQSWISPDHFTFYQFGELLFFTPEKKRQEFEFLLSYLKIMYAGTNMATLKHDKLIPDHAVALSVELNREMFPVAEVNDVDAIHYLRRDAITIDGMAIGFTLLTFQQLPIGWVNILANRVNNMYPSEWRIRMGIKV